jgi:hypothetical protein
LSEISQSIFLGDVILSACVRLFACLEAILKNLVSCWHESAVALVPKCLTLPCKMTIILAQFRADLAQLARAADL